MKKILILLLLCAAVSSAQGQAVTRNYQSQSLSRVLEDLNAATSHHEISFVSTKYPSSITTWKTSPSLADWIRQALRMP